MFSEDEAQLHGKWILSNPPEYLNLKDRFEVDLVLTEDCWAQLLIKGECWVYTEQAEDERGRYWRVGEFKPDGQQEAPGR